MKTKSLIVLVFLLVALADVVSCSRGRNDAAIIADVQARIHQNPALPSASIAVQASSGVVVLSGSVPTETARIAVENTARQAVGVKGVINNLQVVTAASPPPGPPPTAEATARSPRLPGTVRPARRAPAGQPPPVRAEQPLPAQALVPAAASAEVPPPQPVQVSQPVRPVPVQVTIPQGTRLTVRLIDPVDTAKNKEGDTFRVSLDSPVVIADKTAIPRYADATAQLVSAKSAGRFAGSSSIVLVLSQIVVGHTTYGLQTSEYAQKGASRGSRTAKVVGGTAAVGAIIGAIAGGGKGAAVGAAAGAGAGTAAQAATKGQQIKLPAESVLEFELQAPFTITLES